MVEFLWVCGFDGSCGFGCVWAVGLVYNASILCLLPLFWLCGLCLIFCGFLMWAVRCMFCCCRFLSLLLEFGVGVGIVFVADCGWADFLVWWLGVWCVCGLIVVGWCCFGYWCLLFGLVFV